MTAWVCTSPWGNLRLPQALAVTTNLRQCGAGPFFTKKNSAENLRGKTWLCTEICYLSKMKLKSSKNGLRMTYLTTKNLDREFRPNSGCIWLHLFSPYLMGLNPWKLNFKPWISYHSFLSLCNKVMSLTPLYITFFLSLSGSYHELAEWLSKPRQFGKSAHVLWSQTVASSIKSSPLAVVIKRG